LSLPESRIQYSQLQIGRTAGAVTTGNSANLLVQGNNITGTASTLPSGAAQGDVYKIIFDITNSATGAWVNCASNTLLRAPSGNIVDVLNVVDGFTCYALWDTNEFVLYATAEAAYSGSATLAIQYNLTATVTYTMQVWVSLLGTPTNSINLAPNF